MQTDRYLKKLLLKAGPLVRSGKLFYQRLWWERLHQIGFHVISVERLDGQPVWDVRLRGSLTAQSFLLLSKPTRKRAGSDPLLERQLVAEIQQIAQEFGPPIKRDCVTVDRKGAYFRVAFVWPTGTPGLLLRAEPKPHALSFLIRPWLRRIRN